MDSALILSLMVIAVNVTLFKSFDGFSGFLFRLFKIQAITMITTRSVTAPAMIAAMAAVLNFSEDSVLCCMPGSAVGVKAKGKIHKLCKGNGLMQDNDDFTSMQPNSR